MYRGMDNIPVVSIPSFGMEHPRPQGRGQACGDPPQFLCAAVDVTVDTQNGGVPLDGTVLLVRQNPRWGEFLNGFWRRSDVLGCFMMLYAL